MANDQCLVLLCIALSASMAAAFQYGVGGSGAWTVPADPSAMSYNRWAESKRFQIGDSLLFKYAPDRDSVLQVDKAAYDGCNTSTYIKKYDDGNTVVTLDRSGPFYFISGVEQNCIRNESLVVVVMADRSGRGANPPAMPPSTEASSPPEASSSPPSMPPSPPPTPASPPPSPEASTSPPSMPPSPPPTPASPPPSSEASSSSSPPPPPSESTGVSPSSAPSGEESSPPPPPNGASAKVIGFIGSLGGFLGWLLVL